LSPRPALRLRWTTLSVQKYGNRPAENEDAVQPGPGQGVYAGPAGFASAMADGATQTSFAGLWARLLVEEVVREGDSQTEGAGKNDPERAGLKPAQVQPIQPALAPPIQRAQARWMRELAGLELPWHAEEKVRLGAFSSLLGFWVQPPGRSARSGGTWRAAAVGDTCLVQFRRNRLLLSFPLGASAMFNNSPVLLSSNPQRNALILQDEARCWTAGAWLPGDEFLLMTDALAAWCLRELERGSAPLVCLLAHCLNAPDPQAGFAAWVAQQRAAGALKNDDTSLMWIGLDSVRPAERAARP
jgi:hypothetical protein